jgi:hypothetical protein
LASSIEEKMSFDHGNSKQTRQRLLPEAAGALSKTDDAIMKGHVNPISS